MDHCRLVQEGFVANRWVVLVFRRESRRSANQVALIILLRELLERYPLPLQEVVLLHHGPSFLVRHGLGVTRSARGRTSATCVRPRVVTRVHWLLAGASSANYNRSSVICVTTSLTHFCLLLGLAAGTRIASRRLVILERRCSDHEVTR